MVNDSRPIDDYALAAFISGKLPGNMREEIVESLKDDEDARELLSMAYEALLAARRPDDAMLWISQNWKRAA